MLLLFLRHCRCSSRLFFSRAQDDFAGETSSKVAGLTMTNVAGFKLGKRAWWVDEGSVTSLVLLRSSSLVSLSSSMLHSACACSRYGPNEENVAGFKLGKRTWWVDEGSVTLLVSSRSSSSVSSSSLTSMSNLASGSRYGPNGATSCCGSSVVSSMISSVISSSTTTLVMGLSMAFLTLRAWKKEFLACFWASSGLKAMASIFFLDMVTGLDGMGLETQ